MIYNYYVYLKLDENRILITEHEMTGSEYFHLMDNHGTDRQMLLNSCKLFCLGYIYGSNNGGRKVINDPNEFA